MPNANRLSLTNRPSSISTMTTQELNTTVAPDILEEIRQIKEQNLEILP